MSPGRDLLFQFCSHGGKIRHAEDLVRREDIHAVVRDAAGLLLRHLGGAHIQPFVDLHGVAADDLAGKMLCQRDPQRRLASGRGADDRHDRVFI